MSADQTPSTTTARETTVTENQPTRETPAVDLAALERLVAAAMGSGVAYFAENAHRMDLSAPIAFGNWPSEFLNIRGDLVADLIEASR